MEAILSDYRERAQSAERHRTFRRSAMSRLHARISLSLSEFDRVFLSDRRNAREKRPRSNLAERRTLWGAAAHARRSRIISRLRNKQLAHPKMPPVTARTVPRTL